MLIPTGSKVVIKFTGEHGQVIKDIDGEMFLVQIDDHPEPVPVHGIDLRIVEASEPMYDQGTSKWISDDLNVVFEKGIYVVFKTADHHIINKRYSIFLANMTDRDLVFEYQFRLTREDIHSESPRLSSGSFAKVGSMMYEDLNEKASIVLSVAELTTAGLDEWKTRTLHLKMKQFFSRQQISKADGCLYHQYLLDGWQQMRSDSKPPKLVVQTKKRGRPLPVSGHHIITAGSFDIEIDLHIDKLTAHHHNLDKLQKLTIQLESMKRYIDTAKRLRIDHVFLIHGVGKGKLRDEIAKILRKDEDILYFKNEYHPKYGYGATEVVFR